jgi:hypothetical protein
MFFETTAKRPKTNQISYRKCPIVCPVSKLYFGKVGEQRVLTFGFSGISDENFEVLLLYVALIYLTSDFEYWNISVQNFGLIFSYICNGRNY